MQQGLPQSLWKEPILLALDFQASNFQNCENAFLLFEAPGPVVIDHPKETLQGQRFPHSLCSCAFFSGKPVGLTIVTISFSSQGKYIWPQCASFQKTSYILPIYPYKAKYPYFALEKQMPRRCVVCKYSSLFKSYTGLLCGFFLKNDGPSHQERKVVAGYHYGHFLTQATFTTHPTPPLTYCCWNRHLAVPRGRGWSVNLTQSPLLVRNTLCPQTRSTGVVEGITLSRGHRHCCIRSVLPWLCTQQGREQSKSTLPLCVSWCLAFYTSLQFKESKHNGLP